MALGVQCISRQRRRLWADYAYDKDRSRPFLVVILLSFASVIYHGVGLFGIVILALLALPITIAIGALFIQLWGLAMIVLIGLGIFIFMGLVYSNLRYRLSAQVQPASHNPGRPSL